MIGDIPRITDASHAHTTYSMADMGTAMRNTVSTGGAAGGIGGNDFRLFVGQPSSLHDIIDKHFPAPDHKQEKAAMAAAPTRRLVQVFIADPDENVSLEKSLLYTGPQKLTDATDQELFFEIDIKSIMEKHNAVRLQLVNKKVKERVEYLEPARVRDLRMVVVNVASF